MDQQGTASSADEVGSGSADVTAMQSAAVAVPAPPPVISMAPGMTLPPLPPNWSHHLAPDGKTPYYYNNLTKQSTYVRPLPQFPPPLNLAPPLAAQYRPPPAQPIAGPSQQPQQPIQPPKAKEKPKEKILIPGTTWTRVITNQGNVFYTEKESKRSSWTVPDEIKEEVEAYDAEQKAERIRKEEAEKLKLEEERKALIEERERIRKELEAESRARKEAEEKARRLQQQQMEQERERKRKERDEEDPEAGQDDIKPTKVAKLEHDVDAQEEGRPDPSDNNDGGSDEAQAGPLDDDDEEAWQKAVAAEIAAEHAIEEAEKKAAKLERRAQEEAARQTVFQAPVKVDLTVEEGKALFMALLHEKEISPFAPWETSLPLFINDPRYILLSSLKDRQDTYEDYCREVARARRLNKGSSARPAAAKAEKKDPEAEFKALLRAEVTSTRTIWDDFRRNWRKDRRYFEFGREDRAREKLFRQHLKELGERKRASAERAEADFMELLQEAGIQKDSIWKEVKKPLVTDPRYDAVGSSSLREELFKRYQSNLTSLPAELTPEEAEAKRAADRKARVEASLREREAKVRGEKAQLEKQIHYSKVGAGREEGEAGFRDLLLQAVRDHDATYAGMVDSLRQDPRFHHAALNEQHKQTLFRERIQAIARKRLEALHALFAEHAPKLDTPFEDVFPEVVGEAAVTRLQLTPEALKGQYETWQRVRFQTARRDFDDLLRENKFVDFWGRLRNKTLEETIVEEDEEHHDEELEGGPASLVDLAKQIDLKAIHDILRNDARYRKFDYIEDQRATWVKEWVENLAVAQATVHGGGQM